ncbi:uncharacterized protein LOC144562665 isoform X2 [Carex rostrata]
MDPNKNDQNRPLSPPPLPGERTNILWLIQDLFGASLREVFQVKEELGRLPHYNLPPRVLPYPNKKPQYGLRFINKVKDPTYTTKPVRDNNGDRIRVEIYNSYNQSRVSPDCFLSSAKVRIIVLDADFSKNRLNWSTSEFVENMLTESERKRPFLTGRSLIIQLKNGVGTFENIVFKDNSSWTKSGFRLGVMVESDGEEGYLNGERVQEGVSEPFRVKDRRGKASQKLQLLKQTHSVRCIKKIGKDRASLPQKNRINTVQEFLKSFNNDEPELHKVREEIHVREELDKRSNYNLPPPKLLPDQNLQARYRLQFINKVKDPTFTTDLVRDNNGYPIKVAIDDSYTRSRVSCGCFLSSAKIRITVLNALLWENKGENWSRSEFNHSVLKEREGKGPILIGPSHTIRLENGVGTFRNIVFSDNSSWTKSGFRLGVMVEGEGEEGYLNGERVQEGVSEPFRVKDRRGKASQKPDQLKLTHSIQCIKKIGKDRASLLQKKNINTVEDFLKLYYNDESALCEILGIKSESDKGWMSMVEHATQCADEFHAKCNALNNSSQPRQVREEIHVREELGQMSNYNLPPQRLLPDQNIQPRYQLQFINKVKDPTFTTKLVRDNNGDPIRVEIYDSYIRSRVSPDSFLSSAKVRITVLDAEFCKNRGVNWSRSEFVQNVLGEREGKGPILTGRDLIIRLENGVGTFENIVFNDNSSWTKSGFRLGVMVEVEGEEGYLNGARVQEGVGDHFQVRDRRGEASQKPDRLKLTHKVHSLKKVGKDRASLLQKKNINTVEDFLKLYYSDEPALREILCIKSESDRGWMSMVEHVTQCADEFHAKYNALNNSSQPRQVSMDKGVNNLKPSTNQFQDQSSISSEALVQPMGRNMSLCANGGLCVVGSGSSEPNPCENEIIGGDILIYGSSSMNVLNEHILTASVPAILFETNRTNVERRNILKGNSVQHTNDNGFH